MSGSGWRFVRVEQGQAYWRSQSVAMELAPHDLLVVPPQAVGMLRASQLGPVVLQHFQFRPELLAGLLTLSEMATLAPVERRAAAVPRHLPSAHGMAHSLEAIIGGTRFENTFHQRCRLLEFASSVLAGEVAIPPEEPVRRCQAQERFREILTQMPESEILSRSPGELARRCGCSLRHFSRMFRTELGVSFRSKQTRLRMQKATQLLQETDAKIIDVAFDSGYRHLGLFNATFRKFYGTTPGEWRRQTAKTKRRGAAVGLACAALLWLCLPSLFAAEPAAKPAEPKTFLVKGYEITGNTLMPYAAMESILTNHIGPAVTFDTIRTAVMELQSAYRGRGFVTVAVSLPQQQLTNGIVKVQVTEGRLADVTVVNNKHYSEENVRSALPSLRTNSMLNSLVFQQELDRANANRDRQIYPELRPGPEPGTTGVTLKVKDRLPLHGHIELNNQYTPGTPTLRLNSAVQYNNLWQLDHQVGLQYGITPENVKSDSNHKGWMFDKPLIANYSTYYRAPLGLGTQAQDRSSAQWQDFGYDEVTRRFRAPPLSGKPELIVYASRSSSDSDIRLGPLTPISTGGPLEVQSQSSGRDLTINENLGIRFSTPLHDWGALHSSLSFGLDFKSYILTSWNTNTFFSSIQTTNNGVLETITDAQSFATPTNQPTVKSVAYLPLALSWDGSWADGTGNNFVNLTHSFHLARLIDGAGAFQESAYTPKANGSYYLLNASFTREQKLPGEWSLRLRADGQWATQPLLANEQFGIGGVSGVRGYREGEEYGDAGWRALVEPRTPFIRLGELGNEGHLLPIYMRGSVFMDYGQRMLFEPSGTRRSTQDLWGAGVGVSVTIGDRIDLRCLCAWPLISTPSVRAGNAHATFSFSGQF